MRSRIQAALLCELVALAWFVGLACDGESRGEAAYGPYPFEDIPEVPLLREKDVETAKTILQDHPVGSEVLGNGQWDVARSLPATMGGAAFGLYLEIGFGVPQSSRGPWTQLSECSSSHIESSRLVEFSGLAILVDLAGREVRLLVPFVIDDGEPRYLVPSTSAEGC